VWRKIGSPFLPPERRQKAHDMGAEIGKEFEDFEVTNAVFSKFIEPTLINPTFVTHLPKELVPLAKLSPDDPTTVEVFECCINGQEISPGYTEQNDPISPTRHAGTSSRRRATEAGRRFPRRPRTRHAPGGRHRHRH
jgi:lysyl-tRNA synthetase class II